MKQTTGESDKKPKDINIGPTMFKHIRKVIGLIVKSVEYFIVTPQSVWLLFEPLFVLFGFRNNKACSKTSNILVIRLDYLGDLVMLSPMLRELRGNYPFAHITLIVNPDYYNLVELCPHVDKIITFSWSTKSRFRNIELLFRTIKLSTIHLWRRRYDLAILPRWDRDRYGAVFMAYLSGAKRRVGYPENFNSYPARQHNWLYKLINQPIKEHHNHRHTVDQTLSIITGLGGVIKDKKMELWLSPEDETMAIQLVTQISKEPKKLIAMAPGAGGGKRQWPVERFTEVAIWLLDKYKPYIILLGGYQDRALSMKIKEHLGEKVVDVTGKMTIRQSAALLKKCSLFIGNDSGTMHLAVAAQNPVVEISCQPIINEGNENSPLRFGPWLVPNIVVRPRYFTSPCSIGCNANIPHCILGVNVLDVCKAIEQLGCLNSPTGV